MELELILRLTFAGAAMCIGLVLGIALLVSKKTNKSTRLLLFIITLFFIGLTLDSFLMYSGLYKNVPHLVLAVYPIAFLIGAVYYFYIRIILEPNFKFRWYDIIHLVFVIRMYYIMKWFFPQPTDEKVKTLEYLWFSNPNKLGVFEILCWSEDEFLTIFYLVAAINLIKLAINKLKSKSSNTDIEYLNWLKKSTYVFLGLTLLEVLRAFVVVYYELSPGKSEITSSIIFLIFIVYLIFQIIQKPEKAFYTLTDDLNTKAKHSFKMRMDAALKNLSSLFKGNNHTLVIITICPLLIAAIYFHFFDLSFFFESKWYYIIGSIVLFFMVFQFTIIDHRIIFLNTKNKTPEVLITKDSESLSKQDVEFVVSLKEFMKNKQPYHDSNLKSHELARLLNTTPHYLSKVINQEVGQNFYTFINSYRVEEFKKRALLEENKHLTLTGIAEEVGFNSKSSFNRIFKTMSGMTPTEYIKNQKKSINF